jgi:hypothetical protein
MKSYFRLAATLGSLFALASLPRPVLAQAPLNPDVGDVDSFGHTVIYLGRFQSIPMIVRDPCSPGNDPTKLRCTNMLHDGLVTNMKETDLGVMHLPARATKTLICFAYNTQYRTEFSASLSASHSTSFFIAADITIENSVLNDPALVDPFTGQPLAGKLSLSLTNLSANGRLFENDFEVHQESQTLFCGGGLISRRILMERYKLSATQATAFFTRPITVRFGASGSVLEGFLDFSYSMRFFGDN